MMKRARVYACLTMVAILTFGGYTMANAEPSSGTVTRTRTFRCAPAEKLSASVNYTHQGSTFTINTITIENKANTRIGVSPWIRKTKGEQIDLPSYSVAARSKKTSNYVLRQAAKGNTVIHLDSTYGNCLLLINTRL